MNNKKQLSKDSNCTYRTRRGRKRYNAQMASAYIVYMILGSAFKRCIFASSSMEERLRFEYMKMPLEDQYEIEEKIIEWMDRELFLREYADIWCKVFTYQEGAFLGVRFETYFGAIDLVIGREGYIFQPRVE